MTKPLLITRWGWACMGTLLLILATLGASAAYSGVAATRLYAASPKRVLILDPFGRDVAPFSTAVSAFRSTLARELGEPVDIYEVPLELARFAEPEGEGPLVAFLEGRIKSQPVDLVVTIGTGGVQFAVRHRERLFPDTPVLVVGSAPPVVPPGLLRTNATLVAQRPSLTGMVEDILQMQPQTTNIVVVFGASALERFWVNECHREFQSFTNRVGFTWLNDLSLEQILGRCAALPPRSFILHVLFVVDAAGVPSERSEALRRLHEVANAPLFGYYASEFGLGTIGGRLYQDVEVGAQGARTAIRILRGERPENIPPQVFEAAAPVFDWRELQRWGISEANLPAGSVIQFRQPGFWKLYRWPITGTALFCLLQAALIIGLLVNRAQRRQGEAEATLVADISSKFVNLPAHEVDREIEDALRRVCESLGIDLAMLWQWSGAPPGVAMPTHAYCAQEDLRPSGPMSQDQYPWAIQQVLAGRSFAISSLDEYPAEAAVDRQTCRQFGIKAGVCIPLLVGGKPPVGALGLNALRAEREWPEALVKRLQLVAQIFANALARKRADQALRESERRLSMAADAAEAGLWVLDFRTRVFWATQEARAIFGYSPEEVVNMDRLKESVHPDDWDLVQGSLDRSVKAGEPVNVEYRIRLGDGRTRWIASRGRPDVPSSGEPKRLMGLSMDITERKRAEEALGISKARLAAGVDIAGLGFAEVDERTGTVFADDRFSELIGVPPDCEQGMQIVAFWKEHLHPDDVLRVLRERQEALDGKRDDLRIEYRYLHPVRGEIWIQHIGRPTTRDATGFAVKSFSVFRDITEHKQAMAALRASEEVSRATFEQAAVGIAHVGTDGRWLRVNDKLCAIVGYSRDELMKLTFQDITHPEDLDPDLNFVRQVLSGEIKTYSMEKRYLRKDRSVVWVILTVSLVRTAAGAPLHFIAVVEDITERKRSEATLRDLSGRLIHAQEEERARLARELHDGLSQNLALHSVQLELMAQRPPTAAAELASRLQDLSAQTKKLSSEVHRISHDLHPAKLTQLGLTAAVAELCHECLSVHRIPISFQPSPIPRSLPLAVALCLYRVAQECIQNIVKHSGAQQAEVQLTLVKNEIHLCVADDGRGFDVEAAQTTSSLGLVSMRERVRLVGGEIRIESKPGQGTRITVRTPVPEKAKP